MEEEERMKMMTIRRNIIRRNPNVLVMRFFSAYKPMLFATTACFEGPSMSF